MFVIVDYVRELAVKKSCDRLSICFSCLMVISAKDM